MVESIKRVVFPNAGAVLQRTLRTKGVDSSVAEYRRLKATYPTALMRERYIGRLGYQALRNGDARGAIKLFRLDLEGYPNSAQANEGLGDAWKR